jgi:uncharacterized protein DUF4190/zinc ribbon protein
MNCPTCGAQNLPNASFCSQCATNLLAPYGAGPAGLPQMTRTSGMAIAGFILSFFCGLLGLIFSIIGYSECKKSNGTVTGEGLALAGIIISILSFLIGIAMVATGSGHHGRHY